MATTEERLATLEREYADLNDLLRLVDARTLQRKFGAFDASSVSLGEFIGLKAGDSHIQLTREAQTGLLLVSVTKRKPMFTWQPDAAPTAALSVANGQGGYHHSGLGFTATKFWIDADTAPGVNGLTLQIQYNSDDTISTSSWTTIVALTLSSAKSGNTTSMTNAAVPADRALRMNVTAADATVRKVSCVLEGDYG